MPNVGSITIAGGVPTTGDGTVSTLDSMFGAGASQEIVPTVTVGAYSANFVIGGIIHFTNVLSPIAFGGLLESVALKFKATVQTVEFDVALFDQSPIGTFSDHGSPVINVADSAHLIDIFQLTNPLSVLGSHSIYSLSGIGRQIVSSVSSPDIYAVVIARAAPVNPASNAEMSLRLSLAW